MIHFQCNWNTWPFVQTVGVYKQTDYCNSRNRCWTFLGCAVDREIFVVQYCKFPDLRYIMMVMLWVNQKEYEREQSAVHLALQILISEAPGNTIIEEVILQRCPPTLSPSYTPSTCLHCRCSIPKRACNTLEHSYSKHTKQTKKEHEQHLTTPGYYIDTG